QRRGRRTLECEPVGELRDVPARRDAVEILAQCPVERARVGTGEHVEVPTAGELIRGVRQGLGMTRETAGRLSNALRDDAHFAEMSGEEREDPIRLAEVNGLEHDRLGTVRA